MAENLRRRRKEQVGFLTAVGTFMFAVGLRILLLGYEDVTPNPTQWEVGPHFAPTAQSETPEDISPQNIVGQFELIFQEEAGRRQEPLPSEFANPTAK